MNGTDELTPHTVVNTNEIGHLLLRYREKRGLTLEQVASELRLTVWQLAALEAGQFAKLRSGVFIKGYLRACARLYGVDGEALVQAYERIEPAEVVVIDSPSSMTVMAEKSVLTAKQKQVMLLVCALLLLVVFSLWLANGTDVDDAPIVASNTDSQIKVADSLPVIPAAVGPMDTVSQSSVVPPENVATKSVTTENTVVTATTSPAVLPASDAPEQAASQEPVLHLEFSDDCWIRIRNSEGKVLHEKTYHKGDVLDFPVSPPVHIWFGRVAAVNATYNGVSVNVPVKPGFQSVQFVLGDDTHHTDNE
ncbi:MAG: DUF4115 domain-containing protein [Pseudomonadales bacterium]|nr:DUF4115 domain-containing protein [Pseudomonadales bacterium]